MLYLSQLLGTPVEDPQGVRIGKISGVMIPAAQVGVSEPVYPSALLVEGEQGQSWRVPTAAVAWQGDALRLRVPLEQLAVQPLEGAAQELNLAREVLDKQVIDIARKKAVRVNDVCMDDDWRLLGIDDSTVGLLRRLAPAWLLRPSRKVPSGSLIPWEHIELIGTQLPDTGTPPVGGEARVSGPLSRTPSGHLAELRPADIADIVHQLTPGQGARLIEGLDDERAAGALEAVRNSIKEDIRPAYVYCVADATQDESVLLGVVSLWDLLVAPPAQPLQELMETDIVTVHPDADPRAVAEIMAKYNLLAVPVVSAEGVLEGIVTVDDALDVLLPRERRRKPTRMY